MRISKANKLCVSALSLFYVATATITLAEHTFSLTHSFLSGAKSEQANKRLRMPRQSQKNAEDPVVITGLDSQTNSPHAEAKTTLTPGKTFTKCLSGPTPSRAPPVLL
jgi:hypothetical protein